MVTKRRLVVLLLALAAVVVARLVLILAYVARGPYEVLARRGRRFA